MKLLVFLHQPVHALKFSSLGCARTLFLSVCVQKKLAYAQQKNYDVVKFQSNIKQFMVTNCSKERPSSIVTETLKNGILIPIVTSKESHFNADFKYISFIKISLTHQKLRAWENLPHFRKQGLTPPKSHKILTKITPSDSAYQRTLLQKFQAPIYKKWNFAFFARRQIKAAC